MFSIAEKSLYVRELDLWIDSMRARSRCYVSHGHSDHARVHDIVVSTPQNAAVCRHRFGGRAARKQTSLLPGASRRRSCSKNIAITNRGTTAITIG